MMETALLFAVGVAVAMAVVAGLAWKKVVAEAARREAERVAAGEREKGLIAELATERAKGVHLAEALERERTEAKALAERLRDQFRLVAGEILEDKAKRLTEEGKASMTTLLAPLREQLEGFRKKVEEVHESETRQVSGLEAVVRELSQKSEGLGKEARSLATALRSDSKRQGRWGEITLERILEESGLQKGLEYAMEAQLTDDQGRPLKGGGETKMRPDAVITLPGERAVIVDAKVSLTDFVAMAETEEETAQAECLKRHVASVKRHIQELRGKAYDDYRASLDFVLMFIPSEAAYMAALHGDPGLWQTAYAQRIVLVTPSTLMLSVRIIHDLWKREQQDRNIHAILERGSALYEKFVTFTETLSKVGENIAKAQDSYDQALRQLSSGPGNLVRQTETLRALGVKSQKALPNVMLANANDGETP